MPTLCSTFVANRARGEILVPSSFAVNAYLSEVKRFGRAQQLSEGNATLTAESLERRLDRNRALAFIAGVPRVVEGTTGAAPNKVIQINKSGKTRGR